MKDMVEMAELWGFPDSTYGALTRIPLFLFFLFCPLIFIILSRNIVSKNLGCDDLNEYDFSKKKLFLVLSLHLS